MENPTEGVKWWTSRIKGFLNVIPLGRLSLIIKFIE